MKTILAIAMLCLLGMSTTTAAAPTEDARLEQCRAKLNKAKKLDVLYDLAWEKGVGPRVLVGPTYFTIPIDAKEGFAETLNCFLTAGKSGQCMNFTLRDWRTGKAVGRFENCRLKVD